MILRDRDESLLPFSKGSSRVNFPPVVPWIFLVCSLFRSDKKRKTIVPVVESVS